VRAVVITDTITRATQGAKGRQGPRFFADLNKRWRLPLFLFFCDESQAYRVTLRFKFWRLNVFSAPTPNGLEACNFILGVALIEMYLAGVSVAF
jgi:hypothetical protein